MGIVLSGDHGEYGQPDGGADKDRNFASGVQGGGDKDGERDADGGCGNQATDSLQSLSFAILAVAFNAHAPPQSS